MTKIASKGGGGCLKLGLLQLFAAGIQSGNGNVAGSELISEMWYKGSLNLPSGRELKRKQAKLSVRACLFFFFFFL